MIDKESYTIEWIEAKSKENRNADKILVEKVIMAFHLLEQLKLQGIEFIFKGGTSLIILMDEPKRFSIDIDIIIENKTIDLDKVFEKIINDSQFNRYEEQKRHSNSGIDKAHYKFYYNPATSTRGNEEYILLDILFEKNHYSKIKEFVLNSIFIKTDDNETKIKLPVIDCIVGDKLTAFAPNTTGVPYKKNKEIEIIKQLFDIGNLFDQATDLELTRKTYNEIVETELKYRDLKDKTFEDVLDDTINTSMIISLKGKLEKENFDELQKGVKNIVNFIFSERYNIDKAIIHASKAAYLSALLKKKKNEIEHYTGDPLSVKDFIIEDPEYNKLNKLKKSNPEAYFYWCQTVGILNN